MDKNKKRVLECLVRSQGVVSAACKTAKVPRSTFYKWLNGDEKFKEEVEAASEIAIDFVESALFKKIKRGDTTAIIFFLKTRAKKRGYVEKQEVDLNPEGKPISITLNLNK